MRADMDFDTLLLCRKAGLRTVCVGFESGSDMILAAMGKNLTTARMRRFASDCRRAHVRVHGCFMVGNPGETRETMEQTLSMAMKLRPDTAQFFPIMAYPGTRLYDQYQRQGLLRTTDFSQWLTPEGLHNCVVDLPGLPAEELVGFCNHARKKFYLRPSYVSAKVVQSVLHPCTEGKRNLKAFGTFRRHLFRGSK